MFFTDDDEGDFLTPGGSKLGSIFGMDKATNQGGNESLTYTAPKQPKKKESGGGEGAASASATGVSSAVVVHAYKLVDGQYASQGKVGAAILSNHAVHEYRILLYVSKQQQLTNAKITSAFSFNIQSNNYANFYDDARVNWSIMFSSVLDAEKFAKEVALSKALSSGGQLSTLVQQDLQLGDGGGLESGDSVEAKYTGWLLTNSTFGQVFDSNTGSDKLFRFKVGKGKVIKGWDQGMLGMRKGGKRLLVVPPSLAYGVQGVAERIPANSTLIFEVEVIRVKLSKGEATPEPAPLPVLSAVTLPADTASSDGHEDTVKERSKSITEQLSQSPKSDKAKLISRMAKMGQPMLPSMPGAVPAQPDSEEEPPSPQPVQPKPQLPAKPHLAHPQYIQPAVQPVAQPQVQMASQSYLQQPVANMADPSPSTLGMMSQGMLPQGMVPQSSQPAFLQNLPGTQQLSLYQPQPVLQQQAMYGIPQPQMGGVHLGSVQMPISQPQPYIPQATPLSAPQSYDPYPSPPHGLHPLAPPQQSLAPTSGGLVPAASSSSADAMAPLLLSETRQQNTEMRMAVSKMSDKVDRILEKVESLNSVGSQSLALPAPTMETSILMHNISRIVQENERLKKEVFERGEKIDQQNDKIAELLQKNQKYVEKSNFMLEERNEGYKLTANQSQSRILALEQEKVQLATELSSSSALMATLQLELGDLRKKEGELRQQLQMSSSSSTTSREELDKLRLQRAEDEKKLADLTASLREEKTARKQSEEQLHGIQEELTDLKVTCSTLERNLNERKRKAADERKKLEEETEELKAGYESEIKSLREKLRKQRTNTDVETADKIAKMEEEMAAEWQAKCDKMVAAAGDKHARQLASVRDDLDDARSQVALLEAKIQELRAGSGSTDSQIQDLQRQLAENAGFQEKYENLRSQASIMKQRYEDHIAQLEESARLAATQQKELLQQLEQARQQEQQHQHQLQQQQQQLRQQQQQLQQQAPAPAGTSVSGDVATEVKKIMNSVFQRLRGEFDTDESYTGQEIVTTILGVIKETTLKLVQPQAATAASKDEDSNEEEEDEEDEEEEETSDGEEEIKERVDREEKRQEVNSVVKEDIGTTSMAPDTRMDSEAEDTHKPAPATHTLPAATPVQQPSQEKGGKDVEAMSTTKVEEQASPGHRQAEELTVSSLLSMEEDEDVSSSSEERAEPEASPGFLAATAASSSPTGTLSSEALTTSELTTDDSFHTPPNESEKPERDHFGGPEPSRRSPSPENEEESQSRTEMTSDGGRTESESLPTLVTREPPPLFDAGDSEDEDEEDDSPLFGKDSTVADTLGSHFETAETAAKTPGGKAKEKLPSKADLLDEDDRPKPPPPLFGDDDDDDDLDWLS